MKNVITVFNECALAALAGIAVILLLSEPRSEQNFSIIPNLIGLAIALLDYFAWYLLIKISKKQ